MTTNPNAMNSAGSVRRFYDQLAADYNLIFGDWDASVQRQGETLDRLIRGLHPAAQTLLDCSAGIGTQAVGLAGRGYTVHATDLSPEAVRRAAHEANRLGVTITTGVADMRRLDAEVEGQFDVVLSCDNAWAHLLADDDLYAAARGMASKLRPGGLLLVSLRDYDRLAAEKPRSSDPLIYEDGPTKRIFFQVWDWTPSGRSYVLHHTILQGAGDDWRVTHGVTELRALQRAEVNAALQAAGLIDIRWHMPDPSGFYQPIVSARAP